MKRPVNENEVLRLVAHWYRVTPKQITSFSRTTRTMNARRIAIWYLSCHGWSLRELTELFGKRDHSSIFHHVKLMRQRLDELEVRQLINYLDQKLERATQL